MNKQGTRLNYSWTRGPMFLSTARRKPDGWLSVFKVNSGHSWLHQLLRTKIVNGWATLKNKVFCWCFVWEMRGCELPKLFLVVWNATKSKYEAAWLTLRYFLFNLKNSGTCSCAQVFTTNISAAATAGSASRWRCSSAVMATPTNQP